MEVNKYCFDGHNKFNIRDFDPADSGDFKDREDAQAFMDENLSGMKEYQDKFFAEGKYGILIIFQAMDAAGKDSAVKHVFSGLNPQGVSVYSFKAPSAEELSHDYLWRASKNLPRRGKIAIFNRSYYEDVLIARVHKLYKTQNLSACCQEDEVIDARYKDIKNFEKYLSHNGFEVVKFFLHISKDEQKKRFMERIDDKTKNWKFSASDMEERQYWDDYQEAYEKAINKTATQHSPWFVVPSDRKWFTRALISEIIVQTFKKIDPQYPKLPEDMEKVLAEGKKRLLEQ